MKPKFKGYEKIIENPRLVFLQDNSSSIVSNHDDTSRFDTITKNDTIEIKIVGYY